MWNDEEIVNNFLSSGFDWIMMFWTVFRHNMFSSFSLRLPFWYMFTSGTLRSHAPCYMPFLSLLQEIHCSILNEVIPHVMFRHITEAHVFCLKEKLATKECRVGGRVCCSVEWWGEARKPAVLWIMEDNWFGRTVAYSKNRKRSWLVLLYRLESFFLDYVFWSFLFQIATPQTKNG